MFSVVLVHVHESERNLLVGSYQVFVKFLGSNRLSKLKFERAYALILINALSLVLLKSNWEKTLTRLPAVF